MAHAAHCNGEVGAGGNLTAGGEAQVAGTGQTTHGEFGI